MTSLPMHRAAGQLALAAILSTSTLPASVRCAPLDHPGACDTRHATIQAAVDVAVDGDTILVAAGTYAEQVTVTKSLTLRGAQAGIDAGSHAGPETILQHPLGALVVVSCGNQVVVDGFTVAGASDPEGNWAGLWITSGVSCGPAQEIRVENNVVRDNIWGLWVNGGIASVRHNLFINNAALPGVSQGVHSESPAEQLLVEQNDFEGHLDDSIAVSGPTSVTIRLNRFERRIRLEQLVVPFVAGNVGVGGGPDGALIDLTGGVIGANILDNKLFASAGRAVRISNPGPAAPSRGTTLHGNCIGNPATVGFEVVSGAHSGGLDATSNWWGAASGPSGIGPGTGAAIFGDPGWVGFTPFLTDDSSCGCTGVDCDDANPCTDDSCEPPAACSHTFNDSRVCDDGNSCTDDACMAGTCVSTPNDANSCTDGSPCTPDACQSGTCVSGPSVCDDGIACTLDQCNPGGDCSHVSTCTDGNPCTADTCTAGGCVFTPNDALPCSDGNPCTVDSCLAGSCVAVPETCDDGLACTIDTCTASGCTHAPRCPVSGLPCVATVCTEPSGTCSYPPRDCDDGLACTTDSCTSLSGCVHQVPPSCDDHNECTLDVCTDAGGCSHSVPAMNGQYCGRQSSCMIYGSARCSNGVCYGSATNECDGEGDGPCLHTWCDTEPGGYCHSQRTNCDDSLACTTDSCEGNEGCGHVPICETDCETTDLRFQDRTTLTFTAAGLVGCASGPFAGQLGYLTLRGKLSQLPVAAPPVGESCFQTATENPSVGDGFWYLVRAYTYKFLSGPNAPTGLIRYPLGNQRVNGVVGPRPAVACPQN